MNSLTASAQGRADTGFQDIKAGARNIVRVAPNRFRLRLLAPLFILIACAASPAHANGVSNSIANGQTVTGTVSGSGSDSYTISAPLGGSMVVSVSETGIHDPSFIPTITLTGPGNYFRELGMPLYANIQVLNAAAGNWTVKVSRGSDGGESGGSYALTLVQVPVAAGVTIGSAMTLGSHSGSNTHGGVDVLSFKGVAGHTATLTLESLSDNGFVPDVTVFTPTGGLAGGFGCSKTCSQDVSLPADGAYTVLVSRIDYNKDVTGTYTLSVK